MERMVEALYPELVMAASVQLKGHGVCVLSLCHPVLKRNFSVLFSGWVTMVASRVFPFHLMYLHIALSNPPW